MKLVLIQVFIKVNKIACTEEIHFCTGCFAYKNYEIGWKMLAGKIIVT